MENKINIAEILKDCPKGMELYSPLCGKCYFDRLNMGTIICTKQNTQEITFTSEGYYMLPVFDECECVLFPSKECRDWSKFHRPKAPNKFDITTLNPFDKVLVRDADGEECWCINFFGYYSKKNKQYHCIGNNNIGWDECIPYEGNEHLLGTTDDCDEYYKTWE